MGKLPTVCPSIAISRDSHTDTSCLSALLNPHHGKVEQLRLMEVKKGQRDILLYHEVNSFVLVTWGTDVVEGCLKDESVNLEATDIFNKLVWFLFSMQEISLHAWYRVGTITPELRDTWQTIKITIKEFFRVRCKRGLIQGTHHSKGDDTTKITIA